MWLWVCSQVDLLKFILELDRLIHSSPGIAGPWKLASAREKASYHPAGEEYRIHHLCRQADPKEKRRKEVKREARSITWGILSK